VLRAKRTEQVAHLFAEVTDKLELLKDELIDDELLLVDQLEVSKVCCYDYTVSDWGSWINWVNIVITRGVNPLVSKVSWHPGGVPQILASGVLVDGRKKRKTVGHPQIRRKIYASGH